LTGLFFGRRGEGKTTAALHLALALPGGIAIFDLNRRFERWPASTTSDLGIFANWVTSSEERILIFRPESDVEGEFSGFAEILWGREGFTLLLDEASQLQTSARAHLWLDRFVRMAPRETIHILQTMHRPADAATICRALADDWYIFRTVRQIDLNVLENECSPAVREAAEKFSDGSHRLVHWDDAHGRMEIWQDPREWFEPLK
jgi:hypothetical protein